MMQIASQINDVAPYGADDVAPTTSSRMVVMMRCLPLMCPQAHIISSSGIICRKANIIPKRKTAIVYRREKNEDRKEKRTKEKRQPHSRLPFSFGDPWGNRTPVTAVKGRCLNLLTNGPGSGSWT